MGNTTIQTKECSLCGAEKDATEENFHRKPRGKYGLDSRCIPCKSDKVKQYQKTWYNKKKSVIQKKVTSVIQEKKSVIQEKGSVIQQDDSVITIINPSTNDRFERLKRLK